MKRVLFGVLVIAMVAVGVVAASAQAHRGRAGLGSSTTYVFTTATNEFTPGTRNQGWWSSNEASSNSNDNYIARSGTGNLNHDYFTFDISGFGNHCALGSSAYLTVPRGSGFTTGAPVLTLGLYDVSTDAKTLSQKVNNPNSVIYNDLGSGKSYGNFVLPTTSGAPFTLNLNGVALAAINEAHQNGQQFFSIGGALINPPAIPITYLFGFTGGTTITLTVTVPKICHA